MPVIRLLIPFFLGIAQQHYWPIPVSVLLGLALMNTVLVGLYSLPLLPFFHRYKSGFINGLSVFLLFTALGGLSVWQQDVRNHSLWPGNIYKESDALVIKLREKPSEKTNSFRATASLQAIIRRGKKIQTDAVIFVYFSKDSSALRVYPGDELVTGANLLQIPANSNPGAFSFRRYAFFQGITHQVFLKNDFMITGNHQSFVPELTGNMREWVLRILQKGFTDKKERGLAEALLMGYKEELDKDLVQSYTNTGVVHIIAISGLHLGLIYWLLARLFLPLSRNRRLKWLSSILIITGLWAFTLLAGAQPSVLRSALMFTCIVIGNSLSRQPDTYNSLALSAFLLLCYNPYWLWDAGFQLSYAAIIGIVAFQQPVYRLLQFNNKLVDLIWQMTAVTLSAQLLTLPICIFQFHQFPNYFLISNLVAVPLSSLILLLEILLCMISFMPPVFFLAAKCTSLLIQLMNVCITRTEQLPFAVWHDLQISFIQAVLLTVFIVTILCCLIYRDKLRLLLYTGAVAFVIFSFFRCASFLDASRQKKIIVYQQAVDLISGRCYISLPLSDKPDKFNSARATRSLLRLLPGRHLLLYRSGTLLSFLSERIVIIGDHSSYLSTKDKQQIGLVILTGDPAIEPEALGEAMNIRQVVACSSVPPWKLRKWQQFCGLRNIPFHDTRAKGAFVMTL